MWDTEMSIYTQLVTCSQREELLVPNLAGSAGWTASTVVQSLVWQWKNCQLLSLGGWSLDTKRNEKRKEGIKEILSTRLKKNAQTGVIDLYTFCGKRSKRLVYIEGLFVRVGIQPSARMFVFHWAQKFEEEKPVMFHIFRTCHMPYAVMKLFFEMERHWMAVASVQGERLEYWVLCSNVFKHSL